MSDVGIEDFIPNVIDASMDRLVLVDFWAPWCQPCKQLMPILEKLVAAQRGAVRLAKVNIDANPEIAQQMRVRSVPAVFAFFGGQPVDGFMGALPEPQIQSWIERLMKATNSQAPEPDAHETVSILLEQAQERLDAQDIASAEALYADALDHAPHNAQAYAGMIRCKLLAQHLEQARSLLNAAPPEIAKDKAVEHCRAEIELAEQAQKAGGDTQELESKLAANPNDHESRFALAMAYIASNKREEAIEALLEIVTRDRKWNDEAARKQLVACFEAFGQTDPLTISARRRLSSILFS